MVDDGPEKRLNASSISSCNDHLSIGVVNAEGILAIEHRKECKSVLLVQCDYAFTVARSTKLTLCLLEDVCSKLLVVVDLAIHYRGDGLGMIVKWLIAGRCKIVNLKSGVAETFILSIMSRVNDKIDGMTDRQDR